MMSDDVAVSEATIEEAHAVHERIPEFNDPEKQSKEDMESRYHGKEHVIFVAKVDSQPAGYTIGYNRDDDGSFYCWMAGVIPDFRRKGVLSHLMRTLETWAKDHGYRSLKIKTWNSIREMLAFLVKNDFLFTNIEQKEDTRENRIMAEKIF